MVTFKGMIYTRECVFCPGSVTIESNKIKNIESCALSELTQQEQQQYLIPGLVDVHFHGAAGYDFCDGIHVHPSVVRNTFRLFGDDRVILISDSMRAAGMEDGNYTLGGQDVIVKGALATLADGTIAGSVTNLFDCMKKAVSMGISRESAIKAATINPARSIGIDTVVGSLETGKQADVLIVDQDLNLRSVILGGKALEE